MANAESANVVIVDTSAAFPHVKSIKSIKYIAGSTQGASIQSAASSGGTTLWECDNTTDTVDDVCIYDNQGVYVTITGTGVKVYLYLEV